MEETKQPSQSLTIRSAVVVAVLFLTLLGKAVGLDLEPETDELIEAGIALVGVLSAVGVIYGRVRAKAKIARSKP